MRVIREDHPEVIQEVVLVLQKGGVVLGPTDTAYGLFADATCERAVQRVFSLKGREKGKVLSVFVPNAPSVAEYGVLHGTAQDLAEYALPGPLTLVVLAQADHPFAPGIVNDEGEVGIRVTDRVYLQDVLREFGIPVTATSANLAGQDTMYSMEDAPESILEGVDLVVDGGKLQEGRVSTVVRAFGPDVEILREGALSAKYIFRAAGL